MRFPPLESKAVETEEHVFFPSSAWNPDSDRDRPILEGRCGFYVLKLWKERGTYRFCVSLNGNEHFYTVAKMLPEEVIGFFHPYPSEPKGLDQGFTVTGIDRPFLESKIMEATYTGPTYSISLVLRRPTKCSHIVPFLFLTVVYRTMGFSARAPVEELIFALHP